MWCSYKLDQVTDEIPFHLKFTFTEAFIVKASGALIIVYLELIK